MQSAWLIRFVALVSVFVLASSAEAILQRYQVRQSGFTQQSNVSPNPQFRSNVSIGIAVIDNVGGGGSPILKRWVTDLHLGAQATGTTVDAPALSGFAWFKGRTDEFITMPQTGTGDTGSSIEWGDTTGWTITGGNFCHSVPAFICDAATRTDNETVPAPLISSHFDMNSFNFHGTGFTHEGGRIVFTGGTQGTDGIGNTQQFYRGVSWQNGTVPALPALAMGAVGLSVLALGVASVRRRL